MRNYETLVSPSFQIRQRKQSTNNKLFRVIKQPFGMKGKSGQDLAKAKAPQFIKVSIRVLFVSAINVMLQCMKATEKGKYLTSL